MSFSLVASYSPIVWRWRMEWLKLSYDDAVITVFSFQAVKP